jgi:hypothetical protein
MTFYNDSKKIKNFQILMFQFFNPFKFWPNEKMISIYLKPSS